MAKVDTLPFLGRIVYYSGSIRGVPNSEPDFAFTLVNFMLANGANVLSEHVAARTPEEMDEIFARRSGVDRRKLKEPWYEARRIDFKWVDEATHMVAVVNGPSHGVGMEIQRALDKPRLGLNETPILGLIRTDLLESLTWMVRGVSPVESPSFKLSTYGTVAEALALVASFLAKDK